MAHVHEGGKVVTEVYSYSDCGSPLSYNIQVLIRLELFFSLPYVCCNHTVIKPIKFSPLPTAEEDFNIVIKILEFHSGDTYIDVNVTIINDESIEGNETFTIYLTSDVGSTYIETEVTIIDDDYDDGND